MLRMVIHAVSLGLHLARMIGEELYGMCQRNPGSSETSISLLLATQPRSAFTLSFFPSAHLISVCLALFFIPGSYLQRNASLSLSLSGFHYFDFLFLFILSLSSRLQTICICSISSWTLTQTCILQQCHRLKIRTWQIIAINQITFADRIP